MLAGALVIEAVMDLVGIEQLVVCPWALREGIILRRLDLIEEPGWSPALQLQRPQPLAGAPTLER